MNPKTLLKLTLSTGLMMLVAVPQAENKIVIPNSTLLA
jgi:hypothetical protein